MDFDGQYKVIYQKHICLHSPNFVDLLQDLSGR